MSAAIRTIYFKSVVPQECCDFWSELLDIKPHKASTQWKEMMCGNVRLGFLLNDFNDSYNGSNAVPVFEFEDDELNGYVEKAKSLGAKVIIDGRDNAALLSVVMKDPFGNEFELSKFHE